MKPLWLNSMLVFLLATLINVAWPVSIQKAEATGILSSQMIVVGNKDTQRYHLPGMPYYNKVKENQRVYFNSEQQAIDRGYVKAGTDQGLTDPVHSGRGPIIKPAAVISSASKGNAPKILQKKEKISEVKKQNPAKDAEEPLKPAVEKIPPKTVKQETVMDAKTLSPSPVAGTKNPAAAKASETPVKIEAYSQEMAIDAKTLSPSPVAGKKNPVATKASETPVKIEANSLSYDNERDVYSAEGNVVITYNDGVLTAANVEYDRKNNLATAQGNAFLKMEKDTLEGDKIIVNVEDKTGVAYNSKAFYARNHFYIKGDKIEKTGENTYYIEKPLATTCDGDNPDWQLAGSNMKVTVDGYGWMTNARMLTKDVPVIYSPLVAFPAKTKRQTGFLFPYLAYSRDKDGMDIEIPFFWAINPQMDATFYSRYIEKRGFKEGVEFRYFLGSHSFGTIYGDYMQDNKHVTETVSSTQSRDWQDMHQRWSYYVNHQTNFDSQFYVRTDLHRVSDSWYFRDFNSHNYYLTNFSQSEEDPFRKVPFQGNESLPFLESSARLYKGWDNYTLMARISSIDDFSAINNDRTLQQYPEIIFTGIKQPLFSTPVYLEFEGTYDYFYRGEGQKGQYIDFSPTVSLPFNISSYAKVIPQVNLREIYWNRDDKDANSENRSGERMTYNAGLAVNSRISRVFDVNIQNWEKIRHEIKPEIFYSYIPNIRQHDLPDYLPWIDSFLDNSLSSNIVNTTVFKEQNAMAWSLTNTVTARVTDKTGARNYLNLFRFKLFEAYDINEAKRDMAGLARERRPLSDVGMELNFKPHPYVFFAARNRYSVYNGWREMNYDLGIKDWRGDKLTFGYRYTLNSIEEINMDLTAVITEHLSGKLVVRFDQFNNQTVENSVGLIYTEQCWGVGADYTRTYNDERIVLRISLAGLGVLGI